MFEPMSDIAAEALRRYPVEINDLAHQFYSALHDHGGFSLDRKGFEPADGYTVGHAETITLKRDEISILFPTLVGFIADHYADAIRHPEMIFGGWQNYLTGTVELDYNRWHADADTARADGESLHRSVYDVALMDCLVGQAYPCEVCRLDPKINTLNA